MKDLATLQALLNQVHIPYQTQKAEQGATTLVVQPDEQAVLGPKGSQLVYTFQDDQFVSLEILLAAG